MKHTPLPWATNQDMIYHQANPGGHKLEIAFMSRTLPATSVAANNELIVLAVNSHATLLNACKGAREVLKTLDGESFRLDREQRAALEDLESAIEQAGGGK